MPMHSMSKIVCDLGMEHGGTPAEPGLSNLGSPPPPYTSLHRPQRFWATPCEAREASDSVGVLVFTLNPTV